MLELDYASWKNTYETMHRWVQIVGKVRLCKDPWLNHSWHSTLYVTPRGLGTSAINDGDRCFSIDFDFIDQKLKIVTSDGRGEELDLLSESVASFYGRVMDVLDRFGIEVGFDPKPNELADATPFPEDDRPRVYDRDQARRFWQVLVPINNVFKEFRSEFLGKASPVHFFWGSFDLAVSRFSGRVAPQHPAGYPNIPEVVVREAYSHEVSSAGFWPGNEMYPHAAFYSYAYPEPHGFAKATDLPKGAFFHPDLKEYILPYEEVRHAREPSRMIKQFLEETYSVAADLGHWDRDVLERSPYLDVCRRMFHKPHGDIERRRDRLI